MHIFNAGGSARWGPVPFMKKTHRATGRSAFFRIGQTTLTAPDR